MMTEFHAQLLCLAAMGLMLAVLVGAVGCAG
jgi:hypothetical protein